MKKYVGWALGLSILLAPVAYAQTLDKNAFGGMAMRHIGPANMSGRIAALDVQDSDPLVIYVGSAGGGLWKTTNGGTTFTDVFAEEPQSIGAIAIDQQHPDTVWVGTGEKWTRNSVSVGRGLYRSTDGGERWKLMGLENTERIGDIVIHPENSDVVWVAALGHLWGPNSERGVYKTTDGGQTWEQILFIDENTGAVELELHPENPDILYASMWDFRRRAYDFRSGGAGSGLYKTTDGGANWAKVTHPNLPQGTLGRISVAISPVKPERVYTLIEAETTALYRSDDNGENWEEVNKTGPLTQRPFYFFQLYPDPVDADKIYKPGFQLTFSKDGGETFISPYSGGGAIHPDHHAFYINPNNPKELLVGTDGGVFKSIDGGATWRMFRNLPVSTFYHVAIDTREPYNVYGGLQDNGSWMGPSRSVGGIENRNWENLGGGDGFYVFPDAKDDNIYYWQSQGGNIIRYYRKTGESKSIRPDAQAGERLRFNWNTPVHFSRDGDRMYVGAQFLFRSTNRGDSWERISTDLTTNDPNKQKQEESGGLTPDNSTAENHTTIITIGESPLDAKEIWVGTDDGNLQLTRDGGKSWTKLNDRLPEAPANTWVSYVEPSAHTAGTVYVTLDGHRQDDMRPYVYKTTDFGNTWTLVSDDNLEGYCQVIKEDLVNPDLLFLGTELGLFVSIDAGASWVPFKGNMPPVSVRDLVIHPTRHDLVLATHGRGIFILDDITPIRALSTSLIAEDVAFLPSRPSYIQAPQFSAGYSGDDEFVGRNPTTNAVITYYLKKRHIFGPLTLEVLNADGEVIAELPSGKQKGINRVEWFTRLRPPKVPRSESLARGAVFGPSYPPGTYRIRLTQKDAVYESEITLEYDPQSPHSLADREMQRQAAQRGYDLIEELTVLAAQVGDLKKQAEGREASGRLAKQLTALSESLGEMRAKMVPVGEQKGISGQERLRELLTNVFGDISRFEGAPTQSQLDRLEAYAVELKDLQKAFEDLKAGPLAKVNQGLTKAGQEPLTILSAEEALKD